MEGVSTDPERSSEVVFHVVFSLLYISPVLSHPLAHHTTTERDTYCDLPLNTTLKLSMDISWLLNE